MTNKESRRKAMNKERHAVKARKVGEMSRTTGSNADLLKALRERKALRDVVPAVLDILENDPLASAGHFRGDMLRTLIDLPADYWRRDDVSFQRYRAVVREGALKRRSLPSAERMAFWTEDREMAQTESAWSCGDA